MTKSKKIPNFQRHPERHYGPYEANLALIGLQEAHGRRLRDCGIVSMLTDRLSTESVTQDVVLGEASRFVAYREISPLSEKERTIGVLLDTNMKTGSGLTVPHRVLFPALIDGHEPVHFNTYTEEQGREIGSMVAQLEDWERQDRLPGIDPLLTHIPLVVGEFGAPDAQ